MPFCGDANMYFYRPGVANGATQGGKSDGILQQTGLNARTSVPRSEPDGSLLNEKRERPGGSDKERANLRAVNKYAFPFILPVVIASCFYFLFLNFYFKILLLESLAHVLFCDFVFSFFLRSFKI